MPDKTSFDEVFRRLKAIFKPYVKKMGCRAGTARPGTIS